MDANPPRKSCDFCYKRKIKCDRQEPRCSTCVVYMVDCTRMAPKRKSGTNHRWFQGRSHQSQSATDARLVRLESQLEHLSTTLNTSPQRHNSQTQLELLTPIYVNQLIATTPREGRETTVIDDTDLPPLDYVRPLVELYLLKFNSVLPLFHPQHLLRLVDDFYSTSAQQRDVVVWAAINVVLSLAYRHALHGSIESANSLAYLGKVQSVLSAVIGAETTLLNIQVLLGLVILLQGSPDQQPPVLLISITLRLAHKIGLHTKASSVGLDAALTQQRARVFWIAYIFDKDLSMRQKQPSIQLDDDIDRLLPSPENDDFQSNFTNLPSGHIVTTDGTVTLDYFLARIRLAIIEGGVYDYLYSARSQKRSPDERAQALDSVSSALALWKASIPPEFDAATVSQRVSSDQLTLLSFLHSTSFMCATLINQAHAWNSRWVNVLKSSARLGTVPSVPPLWESLVDEARGLVTLIQALPPSDESNFWISGCSYMTAMLLLTANTMYEPENNYYSSDNHLVDLGMKTIGFMVDRSGSGAIEAFSATLTELRSGAERKHKAATMTVSESELS